MKNILVPTDFSACATYATSAAFELAKFHGATVHLYTNLKIQYNWAELSEEAQKTYPDDLQKVHNTQVLLKEWERKAEEQGIALKTNWSAGKLIEHVEAYTKVYSIDFMVMGSHGVSGKNEYFIGSNTQKVIRMVHCPVLVIKSPLSKELMKNVLFVSNFAPSEQKAFEYFLDFVRPFNPTVHLLQVNTSSWFGQPYVLAKSLMNDFKALCKDLVCRTHFHRDWSVDSGARFLAKEVDADLIAISNQNRHPLKRMFSGSNVEALVNHAEAPVLSIDFPAVLEEVS